MMVFAVLFGLLVVIPVVAILAEHRQKMAQIMRGDASRQATDERILRELTELRQMVVEQALALDDLRRDHGRRAESEAVKNRLGT